MISDTQVFAKTPKHVLLPKALHALACFLPPTSKKHLYTLSNHSACKVVAKLRFPRFARIAARTNAPFICRRQRSLLFPLRLQPAFGNRLAVLGDWFNSIMQIKSLVRFSVQGFLAPQVGLEPTTLRLTAACSTDWAIEEYSVSYLLTYLIVIAVNSQGMPHRLVTWSLFCVSLKSSLLLRQLVFPSSATGSGQTRCSQHRYSTD